MAGHVIDFMVTVLGAPKTISPFLAHHHTQPPSSYVDHGLAVFGYPHAWAIIEVPSLEVAPHSRRIEVYGTKGACIIPHLGIGHLPNANVQSIETYRAGDADWKSVELPGATLQIADLREFAACVANRKEPNYSLDHDLTVQESLLRSCGLVS
jgi:predicted dehydrogenase